LPCRAARSRRRRFLRVPEEPRGHRIAIQPRMRPPPCTNRSGREGRPQQDRGRHRPMGKRPKRPPMDGPQASHHSDTTLLALANPVARRAAHIEPQQHDPLRRQSRSTALGHAQRSSRRAIALGGHPPHTSSCPPVSGVFPCRASRPRVSFVVSPVAGTQLVVAGALDPAGPKRGILPSRQSEG
jgi:hypothetical protein